MVPCCFCLSLSCSRGQMDKDGSGTISLEEFDNVLSSQANLSKGEPMTRKANIPQATVSGKPESKLISIGWKTKENMFDLPLAKEEGTIGHG